MHTADIQDRDDAPDLLASIRYLFPWLRHVFADGAYAGEKLETALAGRGQWRLRGLAIPALNLIKQAKQAARSGHTCSIPRIATNRADAKALAKWAAAIISTARVGAGVRWAEETALPGIIEAD